MDWNLWKINLQLFSAEGGSGGGSNAGGEGNGGEGDGGQGNAGEKVTFTPEQQAHINALLAQRLERANKSAGKAALEARAKELGFETVDDMEMALKAHREAQEAAKTELQKAQEAKTKAEAEAKQARESANRTLINAEAKVLAMTLGVKAERVDYALRLADLSGVTVSDDGKADSDAIKASLEQVLKDVPELKGEPGTVGSGSNPGGSGESPKTDMNTFIRRSAGR